MLNFENRILEFEAKLDSKNVVEFKFEGNVSEIEDYETDCSCTNVKASDGVLSVEYSNGGSVTFAKSITLYVKDGKPLNVWQNGIKVKNPDKEKIHLFFVGTASK